MKWNKTSKLKLNLNKKNLFRRETPRNAGQLIFMRNDRYTFFAVFRREIRYFAAEFRGEIPRWLLFFTQFRREILQLAVNKLAVKTANLGF